MIKQQAEIEALLHANAPDFEIAKILRKDIKGYFKTLEHSFANSKGKDFLYRHTKALDTLLKMVYKIALRSSFGNYLPMKNSIPITLMALGSYGREQLCVHSDIDLMIVYKGSDGYNIQEIIEKILHILWDCGLKLGHRVHDVEELFEVSKGDITIKTSLIEARFIEGSHYLLTEIQNQLNLIRLHKPNEFVEAKIEELKGLHRKFPLTMESNLKDGAGGFRSANLVYWLGKVLYNINKIRELPKEIIPENEYKNFHIALDFLFRVRSALHLANGRKEDTLRLELIPKIAGYLGYENNNKEHMKFAKKVSHQLKVVKLYTTLWIYNLTERDLLPKGAKVVKPNGSSQTLMELLEQLSQIEGDFLPHPTLLKALIYAEKPDRATPQIYASVAKIFFQKYSASTIQTLLDAHLISYTISPLKKVLNLPQFDGYHQYPVGIHSIKSLYALEHIKDSRLQGIFEKLTLREKALLKLVVLLHDSGKGRSRDHSIVGAELFGVYARKLNFDNDEVKLGKLLILNHTKMSFVAQREDLNSEQTILKFASIFPTQKKLDLIYLLTYADMNGVGNGVYTDFRAKLLRTLYTQASITITYDKKVTETSKRLKKERILKRLEEFKALSKSLQRKILSIPSDLLFMKYPPKQIIEIALKSYKLDDYIFTIKNNNFLTIEIIRKNNLDLSYLLYELRRLDIVNMDICKLFDGIKYFNLEFNEVVDESEIELIGGIILKALNNKEQLTPPRPDILKREIKIDCEHSNEHAIMKLNCKNQKELLCYIIHIFDNLGIDITSAKIHTKKTRVNDLFLIEKNGNFCSNTELIKRKLIVD